VSKNNYSTGVLFFLPWITEHNYNQQWLLFDNWTRLFKCFAFDFRFSILDFQALDKQAAQLLAIDKPFAMSDPRIAHHGFPVTSNAFDLGPVQALQGAGSLEPVSAPVSAPATISWSHTKLQALDGGGGIHGQFDNGQRNIVGVMNLNQAKTTDCTSQISMSPFSWMTMMLCTLCSWLFALLRRQRRKLSFIGRVLLYLGQLLYSLSDIPLHQAHVPLDRFTTFDEIVIPFA
jgi:hypothetical protein